MPNFFIFLINHVFSKTKVLYIVYRTFVLEKLEEGQVCKKDPVDRLPFRRLSANNLKRVSSKESRRRKASARRQRSKLYKLL